MKPSSTESRAHRFSGVWLVALVYLACAGLWFVLSHGVIAAQFDDPERRALADAINDAVFAVVVAALICILLRRMVRERQRASAGDIEALQLRERTSLLLQTMARSSPDVIFAKDREGCYLLFNREAERVTGATASRVLGRDDSTIFAPEQAARVRADDERMMALGRSETFEEEIDTAVGRITFLSTKVALRDVEGRVIGMFGISRDITERMVAQRRLRDSEQRYRHLFESSPQPMWVFDAETLRFAAVNEAAVMHYGYTRAEFLAMTITDLHPTEKCPRSAQTFSEPAPGSQRGVGHVGPCLHRRQDGLLIEVELSTRDLVLDDRPARLVLAHDMTRRRELEREHEVAHAAAIAAGDQLRDVLARVDDGFLALDGKQRYTYANRRAAQLLGRENENELLGRHIWTEFPRIVGSPFHRAYEQATRTQQPVVVEDYYAAGKRWFEGRLYPSADGVSIYFSDITVRKGAEQALHVSELRYRLAAGRGQVWDWDVGSGRTDFPDAFWQQLGYAPPPKQEVSARFKALLHPDDVPRWDAARREHLARRAPYDFEYRARHANGEWRWFHTQGQAVWGADGRATYMAGTSFDITERKRAESALRESEAHRRNLFEQLADAVLLIHVDHQILDANPQALLVLGYGRDELMRLTVLDLLPGVEADRVDEEVRNVMTGRPHLTEWEFVRKDGSRFPVEVSARALDSSRLLAVVRDITARRASDQALLTFQFELSELAHRLLHQERTMTQRVAQALHDHLGQTLAVARLNLDACISVHAAVMPAPLKEQSSRIGKLLEQAVWEVRQVLADLRPPLLEDQGLAVALGNEIGSGAIAHGSADVLLEVEDRTAAQRWPSDVEYSAFMVAREAIANARQHAGASLIRVVLGGDEASLSVDVIDDGKGIASPLIHGRPGHLGIVGMRERSIAIGARFAVEREPEGGTRVTMRWEAQQP